MQEELNKRYLKLIDDVKTKYIFKTIITGKDKKSIDESVELLSKQLNLSKKEIKKRYYETLKMISLQIKEDKEKGISKVKK